MANETLIDLERVWARVDRRGADECWLFTGAQANGYGRVGGRTVNAYAHRVVLTHTRGPEPFERADARHLCGNKLCCNPSHLLWGDRAANEADKLAHGRSNRGERQGQSKLTREDVLAIRSRAAAGEAQHALARAFGIHQSTVSQIVSRKRWAWL